MTESSIPPWGTLPMEPLEAIFRHLGPRQLAQMRLMCRHWNSTICHSPELMKRFHPRFYEKTPIFRCKQAEQRKMAKYMTIRLSQVSIGVVNLGAMISSPVWARMGETIRSLIVCTDGYNEAFAVANMFKVIRMLPNLECLEVYIHKAKTNFEVDIDFKLDRLEKLVLGVHDARFIPLFSKVCENLQVFKYDATYGEKTNINVSQLLPIMIASQKQLQRISLRDIFMNGKSLRQLSSANMLQLKTLSIKSTFRDKNKRKGIQAEDIIHLGKVFPTIEKLKVESTKIESKVLEGLQQNLPRLRALSLELYVTPGSEDLRVFLQKMPQLEYLSVRFTIPQVPFSESAFDLDLRGVSCPKLKKLKLSNFVFTRGLASFLENSPSIRYLSFSWFLMDQIIEVLRSLLPLKSLDCLEIDRGSFDEMNDYGVVLNSVRILKTSAVTLTTCCPNAEKVDLYDAPICNYDVPRMLRALPKLVDLSIGTDDNRNKLSNEALVYIAKNGGHLNKLQILLREKQTSEAVRNKLTQALKGKTSVDFMVLSDNDDSSDSDEYMPELLCRSMLFLR